VTAPRESLIDYQATLDCVHCGLCLPVCPTYQETGRETSSPRGRIYLMRGVAEQALELDAGVAEEMYFCLACRACESACPAGVRYGHLVETMRAEIDARGARSRAARFLERFALRHVVGRRGALRTVAALLRFYQRSGLAALVRRTHLLALVPPLERAERALPELPDPHRPPILVPAHGARRGRVALFAGCVMPELFGAVNAATVSVLAANGFEVHVPRAQSCCGALLLHSGDPQGARRLYERNRSAFHVEDVDAIVVDSAGCGAALREYDDAIAAKVRDVSEFLVEAGLRAPRQALEGLVAYDDPCHLLHGQRVAAAPRALLRAIPGLRVVDLPGASDCCGAAGIYGLTHPEMSARLRARKVDAIRATQPHFVATGNPGCLMQIAQGVRQAGLPVEVVHPVQLLARAYGL
jgi:glycolate oxidase iron-sulfur subunit